MITRISEITLNYYNEYFRINSLLNKNNFSTNYTLAIIVW
jgi:hypothetical protein